MYILASDFFKKGDKYVFKARNSGMCKECLAFIYICTSEILKTRVETRFLVHHVGNTKWILCCRKMVLNAQHLRFLM